MRKEYDFSKAKDAHGWMMDAKCKGEQLTQAKKEISSLMDALDWLLYLKNEKDTEGKTKKYITNQPKAWANARNVVAGVHIDKPKDPNVWEHKKIKGIIGAIGLVALIILAVM